MEVVRKIEALLQKSEIEYTLSKHPPVRTSQEAAKIRGVEIESGAKALIVKAKGEYFLFVVSAVKKLDWKKVAAILGVGPKKVRLASIEEAEKLTGLKVGGIPPFGNVIGLKTYFDRGLLDLKEVNFNAGLKTHSISMNARDLAGIVKPEIVDFCS